MSEQEGLIQQLVQNAKDGSAIAVMQLRSMERQGVDIGELARRLITPKGEQPEKPKKQSAHQDQKESDLQASIVARLSGMGFMVNESLKGSKGNSSVYYTKGTPDLYLLKEGKTCWIELKRPGQHPDEDQKAWHENCRRHGGLVFVVHDFYELWEALQQAGML